MHSVSGRAPILLCLLMSALPFNSAGAVDLPATAPAPAESPLSDNPPDAVPVPDAKPAQPQQSLPQTAPIPSLEGSPTPVPQPSPPADQPPAPSATPTSAPTATPTPAPPDDPRSTDVPLPGGVLTPQETACRANLTALGARFEPKPARADPAGCSIPYPITLQSVSATVVLDQAAELNCATAETLARFTRDVMAPEASKAFGSDIASLSQASAYVCRPRHGTQKLSEHAFGNAIDIAAFTLADKRTVVVEPAPDADAAAFLAAIRKAACGPFKTVLGPGSDADHALHLHFDLAPRRNGATFCQ